MSLINKSKERAEAARLNGAKSKGPVTSTGMFRSKTASYKHGLYSTSLYLMPTESVEAFIQLQDELRAYWMPKGFYDEELVSQLAGNMWETWRIQAAKNDHLHDTLATVKKNFKHIRDKAKLNLEATKAELVAGGTADRACARLADLARKRDNIERALTRTGKRPATSGPSQMSLIINGRQHPGIPESDDARPVEGTLSDGAYTTEAGPEPLPDTIIPEVDAETPVATGTIIDWAADFFQFNPDEVQRQIIEETSTRIMVLAPRQTGKSTAAAVRVLHTAVHNENATVLLASASGRQSGQILQKARQMARQMGLDLAGPPPKCEGFTLANGSTVVALPDCEATIRGFSAPSLIVIDEAAFASDALFKALEPMLTVSNGTFMLLSTPNGQTGYFYEQWHLPESPWSKIFGTLDDCPRVNQDAIEGMRKSMPKADFEQEFECKFVASSGQFISVETFRKCLRDDFEPFCPGWDETGQ